MSSSPVQLSFGGAAINSEWSFKTAEDINKLFDILETHKVTMIDTAQFYGDSETLLGKYEAGKRFVIDTKAPGGLKPGSAEEEEIVKGGKASLERLNVDQVDIFYLHAPDASVPIASTLAGINTLYKAGAFKRFGLSNFKAADVEAVYEHCKSHDYVLPTVYQGNYNAVARRQETVLFPTLRKYNIAFYAYSPIAGGFLTKTKQQILDGKGRFDPNTMIGKMYLGLYAKPAYLEALGEWEKLADDAGIAKAEMAYRWIRYHSGLKAEFGDVIIFGASTLEQTEQTLKAVEKGPLGEDTCKGIEHVWKTIEHEAPLDNMDNMGK